MHILEDIREQAMTTARTFEIDWDLVTPYLPHLQYFTARQRNMIVELEQRWVELYEQDPSTPLEAIEETLMDAYIQLEMYNRIQLVEAVVGQDVS